MAQRYGAKYDWIVSGDIALGPADSRLDFGAGLSISSGAIRCLELNGFTVTLDAQNTWIVNTQVSFSATSGAASLIAILDSGTAQLQLYYSNVGGVYKLVLQRGDAFSGGSTQLAISTLNITANVLHDIEMKAVIDNSVGSVTVKVDGVTFITYSGDTQQTANAFGESIRFGYYSNASVIRDFYHVYIMDGTGSDHNDMVGPLKSTTCRPTGAGNYTQFTPSTGSNWQNVDDSTQDGDSTYNADGTVNDIDSFVINDSPTGATSIIGVSKFLWARRDDATTRKIAAMFRISGTDYVGVDQTMALSYAGYRDQFGNSPATSSAWGISEFNNAESGYKVTV